MADKKTGRVKWFNGDKGYGFIAPDDGSPDVLLHFSTLAVMGISSVPPGQRVRYTALPNPKDSGRLRAHMVEIVATPGLQTKRGTVKWYNPGKGYGFIEPKDGSRDVFMHAQLFGVAYIPKALVGLEVCYTDEPNRDNSEISRATSVQLAMPLSQPPAS
jgi:cold shock CspA family protein